MPESQEQTKPTLGAQGRSLTVANSTAKKKNASGRYNDIASTLFSMGKSGDLNELFLAAARDGDLERMEMFLRRRGDALVSVDVKDKRTGNTPIMWAAKRGHIKIVQLLLRHGADITLKNYDGQTAVEIASPQIRSLLLKSVEQSGSSHRILLQAAWQGNTKLVKKILTENKTLDINCRNADGLTPLLLVTRDVHLFEKLGDEFSKGYNPVEVVSELLSHRADPNLCDGEKKSPLHYVSLSKAKMADTMVRTLITDGSDHEMQDCRCFTPIHYASQIGNVDVVVALIGGGSDVNARGFAGATPLHVSAINGHERVATTLLENGADVSMVDDSGMTPMDVAKNKKVKATLKNAWTEITQKKIETTLSPVKTPVKDNLRGSLDDKISNLPKSKSSLMKKKGEVIFDTLPNYAVIGNLTPRRAAMIKQMSNAEKAKKAEEEMLRELTSCSQIPPALSRETSNLRRQALTRGGPFRHSFGGTSQGRVTPNKALHPLKSRTPRKGGVDSGQDGFEDGGRDSALSVAVLGLEIDDNLQDIRVKRVPQNPPSPPFKVRHKRLMSYPIQTPSPSPSVYELAAGCDEFLLRGISPTKSTTNMSCDDLEDSQGASRLTPLRTPSAGNKQCLRIPDTIQEGSANPVVLDLDKLNITNRMASRSLLQATPDVQIIDLSQDLYGGSSKESSPRDEDDDEFVLALKDPNDLTRSKSILKEDFIIEESRVNNSAKTMLSTSANPPTSNRSSLSSSGISTMSTPSPEPSAGEREQFLAKEKELANKKKSSATSSVSRQNSTKRYMDKTSAKSRCEDTAYKLQRASQQNALQKKSVSPPTADVNNVQKSAGSVNKVTVYSSHLLKDDAEKAANQSTSAENHNVFLTQMASLDSQSVTTDDANISTQSANPDGSTVISVVHGMKGQASATEQSAQQNYHDKTSKYPSVVTQLQYSGSQSKTQSTPTVILHQVQNKSDQNIPKSVVNGVTTQSGIYVGTAEQSCASSSSSKPACVNACDSTIENTSVKQQSSASKTNTNAENTKQNSVSAGTTKPSALQGTSQVRDISKQTTDAPKQTGNSVPFKTPASVNSNSKNNGAGEKKPEKVPSGNPVSRVMANPSSRTNTSKSTRTASRGSVTVISTPGKSACQKTCNSQCTPRMSSCRPGSKQAPQRPSRPPSKASMQTSQSNSQATPRPSQTAAQTTPLSNKPSVEATPCSNQPPSSGAEQNVSVPKSAAKVPPPRPSQPPSVSCNATSQLPQGKTGSRAGARSTGQIIQTEQTANNRVASAKSENMNPPPRPPPPANKNGWVQSRDGSCPAEKNMPSGADSTNYEGPIILDPFESIKAKIRQSESTSENKPEAAATKSRSNLKSASNKSKQNTTKSVQKQKTAAADSRQKSDNKKKNAKTKPVKSAQNSNAKTAGSASGKRKKSGKSKNRGLSSPELPNNNEVMNIALISGINWQIKTERSEQPPNMLMLQSDSDFSDNEENSKFTPRFSHPRLSPQPEGMIPGAVSTPPLKRSMKVSECDLDPTVTRSKSPRLDEGPTLVPQTVSAIKQFSRSIREDSLLEMIGGEMNTVASSIVTEPRLVEQTMELDLPEHSLGQSNHNRHEPQSHHSYSSSGSDTIKDSNHNVTGKAVSKKTSARDRNSSSELEKAIDEILKTTPSLTRSHSLKTNNTSKQVLRRSFSTKISPRSNSGERSFREIQRVPQPVAMVTQQSSSDSDRSQEEACLRKMMDSIGRLKLKADEAEFITSSIGSKPPTGKIPRMETSPRFVRRHTPVTGRKKKQKDGVILPDISPGSGYAAQESDSDNDSLASEALTTSLNSMNQSLTETAKSVLNDPEARVVTSRLGRGSAMQSRSGSACTNDTQCTDADDVIKWKKGNMLGKGAFGTVWCGLTNAGELIAVKQIELNTNDMDKAEREYENIQEEVEILKHLKHKNIVSYLGTSLEDYTVSIFMQFVPGGSVANLLARFGALEEEIFCLYTRQILEGTGYLHANGVIHRDIKGGNVMLMPNGVIKLIDFGCAKRMCINLQTSSKNLLKSMRGTPYWMAPEVVNETGHGTKSDIWSIGCTVFEMATMKPPWADMSAMAAIFAIGSDTKPIPQLPDKFSQHVRDFANACLTRDQTKRPSATELLKHSAMLKNKKQTKKVV